MSINTTADHYRPDIDGLRAIAVALVVGFHAFPAQVPGGFIGVDVFFVISGYLISRIVLGQLVEERFSLAAFYARRIRRIFPALAVVLLAVWLAGQWLLLPAERVYLGVQVAAGAAFVSNFVLWQTFGYFAPAIDALPLMHLWSLGIEEQFYLVWPLLLALSFRWRTAPGTILLLFALLSFAANILSVHGDTTAAFYAPWCRVWEMATGGWLACRQQPLAGRSLRFANNVAVAGAVLLLAGVLLIDKNRFFPGWWALLPVAGTVLLIAAGGDAWINRVLLANRTCVAVGLVSYPLYLWHWPLLSFARILEEATPSVGIRAAAVLLSLVLAWLTWRLVEKPVRNAPRSKLLVAGLCAAMLIVLALGLWMTERAVAESASQSDGLLFEEHWQGWHKCHGSQNCRILDPSRPPDIFVIGDSHAGHLGSGLAGVFGSAGKNVKVIQMSMCLPVYSLPAGDDKLFECAGVIDSALDEATALPSVTTIILGGYANRFIYQYPDGVPGNPNLREVGSDESGGYPNLAHVEAFSRALGITLERLSRTGKRIVFLVDNPELDFEPRACVSLRPVVLPGHQVRTPCAIDRAAYEARSAAYLRLVQEAATRFPSVAFVRTDEALCDADKCWVMKEGELLYSDRSHLTPAGSRLVLERLRDRIR